MTTIAIVIPWFGTWPKWINLFIHSCQHNSSVDYFFFSDQEIPEKAKGIENIHFKKQEYNDYCNMVSSKLNIEFHPSNAYKLCDLKPFYGFLHYDDLQNFDFWGFGDLDLIWGDLRHFYTEDILAKKDIISTHSDRLSGHLTLVRNTDNYRKLGFNIPKWKDLLTAPENHAMDEIHLTKTIYPYAKLLWKIHKHIFLRFHFQDEWLAYNRFCKRFNKLFLNKRVLFVERNTTPWLDGDMPQKEWLYKEGRVIDIKNGEELIYLHFLTMKKQWTGDYYHPGRESSIITFKGIYSA